MANEQNLKPFKKGDDPRRNRKGRPRDFDALRALAKQIASEQATVNGKPVVIDDHIATNIEMVLRSLMSDKKQAYRFIEYAFGKVPDQVEVSGKDGGPVIKVTLVQNDER